VVVEKNKEGMGGLTEQSNNPYNGHHLRMYGNQRHDGILLTTINDYFHAAYYTMKWIEPAALLVLAFWGLICFALILPNPYRALLIWGLVAILALIVQDVNPQGRC